MKVGFSDLLFDPDTRTITRSGEPLHLSPKAFDLLALLIDARPRVVRKREIVDRLWPDVVVEEANVRNLIAEIRGVIADGNPSEWIRTLPRIGYAFCGDVRTAAARVACGLSAIDRDFTLTAGENVIGRADDCAVVIRASGVSRKHARITVSREGDALLEDLGSKNGTFLGRDRIAIPVVLHDGDRIRLGAAVLVFRSNASTKPTTTLARGVR
jgi:DNA-binding winged helix-turn-helix (wHTH) protein